MLGDMFRQDTRSLLPLIPRLRHGIGRNAPCPCGISKKHRHCCLAGAYEPARPVYLVYLVYLVCFVHRTMRTKRMERS